MPSDYYAHGSYPATGSTASSAAMRAELDAVTAGFAKLPVLAGAGLKLVRVNAGATALESTNLIDGITIGSVTPAPGSFTTLVATSGINSTTIGATTPSTGKFTTLQSTGLATLASVAIAAGAIDGTPVGATTPSTGKFTTLQSTGLTTLASVAIAAGAIEGTTVGAVTAATGRFTTLASTGLATLDSVTVTNALTANGNVTLGDAIGDTIAIGGVAWKSATGNYSFPAPSSGITATFTNSGSGAAATYISAAGSVRHQDSTNANYEWGWQNTGGTYRAVDYTRGGGTVVLSMNNAGSVTFAAPSSGVPVTINELSGAVGGTLKLTGVNVGGTTFLYAQNTDNTNAASSAGVIAEVGGTSAGDPYTRYSVAGAGVWAVGLDNSDNDAFVISNSTVPGTTNRLRIAADGTTDIVAGSGKLTMAGGSTRFESSVVTIVGGTNSYAGVSHNGPRKPDVCHIVYRCKTASDGYSVGDELTPVDASGNGITGVWTSSTQVGATQLTNPLGMNKTTAALFVPSAANFDIVYYAHWL